MNSIDVPRLVADMTTYAAEARALKILLRSTWTRPMAPEQKRLVALRRRLTALHVLRAILRGRYHLQKPPRDGAWPGMTWDRVAWHTQTAERTARDYALAIPAASPQGSTP